MATSKRISLAILSLLLILGLCPTTASAAVELEAGGGSLTEGTGNLTGTQVYFGSFNGSPILWNVVATDGGTTATLWTTTSMGNRQYDPSNHNNWSGSAICAWLNGTGSGQFLEGFSSAEQDALTNYGTTEQGNPAIGDTTLIDISQKIVLPSVTEIGEDTTTGTWNIDETARPLGMYWWLRSPGIYSGYAAGGAPDGSVTAFGSWVTFLDAIFPACKLDLSSVIFTSAASGASTKSAATVGGGLIDATSPTSPGPVKITLEDANLNTFTSTTTDAGTVRAGDNVTLNYSGAATGANNFVSCVIEDSSGIVLYYGKLATGSAAGVASFIVPAAADLPTGSYTIQLFCEQANTDNYTDYCSTPIAIPLNVDNTAPVLTVGAVDRTNETNATVKFRSDEAGTFYWQLDGAAPTAASLAGAGTNATPLTTAEQTISFFTLTAGAHTIYIVATDDLGNISNLLTITIPAYTPEIPPTGDANLLVLLATMMLLLLGTVFVSSGQRLHRPKE